MNHTLNSRLQRETTWTSKSSTTVTCQDILEKTSSKDKFIITSPENTFDLEYSRKFELYKSKKAIKETVQGETRNLWNSKVEKLTMQGDMAKLLI